MKWHILIFTLFLFTSSYAEDLAGELDFILKTLDATSKVKDAHQNQDELVASVQAEEKKKSAEKKENPLELDQVTTTQSATDDFVILEE